MLFLLYLPAAQAGRVGDFPGWVRNVTGESFLDYINRKESHIPSMYQFTQTVTWFFYHLWGGNAWAWHLLYITMQAANSYLLFRLFKKLFADGGISNAAAIALGGALLFSACPHISEVVVWEPSFHYLLGFFLILLQLLCIQVWHNRGGNRYVWYAALLFLLSTYSLEVFYLTPLLTAGMCIYYPLLPQARGRLLMKSLLIFVGPQLVLFILHLAVINSIYHSGVAHIGTASFVMTREFFSRPLKYLFHILLFGRYFPDAVRQKFYYYAALYKTLTVFYAFILAVIIYTIVRAGKMPARQKAASLLLLYTFFALGLIAPVWFPDTLLVIYDRYTYVADAFIYMLLCVALSFLPRTNIAVALWALYLLVNVYVTFKLNMLWKKTGDLVNSLITTFPNDARKTVLLLNVPDNMKGMQMIGARDEDEFAMSYNAIMPHRLTNKVYDVSSHNLLTLHDGAHVMVVNDSMLHVTLNQWGTWWVYSGFGATSYENEDFKLNMIDAGHWYELTLKKQAAHYKLLYMAGGKWKEASMARKNVDQN